MPTPLVECIANYSEARRPQVIEAIKEAICSVPPVTLLDQHSDQDHNRSVLTFVGPPAEIEEAAFRSIARAAELIDLNKHRGEHPRIGAADVVPFVPISGVTMADCVEIARRLGQRVGDELDIPVYLYEEAASRPERVNLENIRRGQYETLKQEMGVKPERAPDFGPEKVGPAGATVIGARHPLIAFNVYLDTPDVQVAKKVAKAIRHSSGGLRYVKALGLEVDGLAQVSMNLTNYKATPLARVVEAIRNEAGRYGVSVRHSELVGLIPQQALIDAARWHLQLDLFQEDQILEYRLAAARQEEAEVDFLDALASGEPTPGGGSAAAYSAAVGASLVAMVARLTIGKKKYAGVEEGMVQILEQAESLRRELKADMARDAQAFNKVMEAYRLPKEGAEQVESRSNAIQEALLEAARMPLSVAGKAAQVIELAGQVVAKGNLNAISDGATGAALARAALKGAGYNVRVNVASLADTGQAGAMLDELGKLERQAKETEKQINQLLIERGGLPTV